MITRGHAYILPKQEGVRRVVRIVSKRRQLRSLEGKAVYSCDVLVLDKDGIEQGTQRARMDIGEERLITREPSYDRVW